MAVLMQMEEPSKQAPAGFALWALGFRPFYLLASGFAALSILFWGLQFTGWLGRPYLPAPIWHAHEMIFGFALAVIVGFLFTAGRNWSGLPTPTGWRLAALAALWVAGRVLVLTPFGWAAAVVNAAFPLAAAIAIALPFVKSRNQRNYFFIALLMLMSVVVLGIHLEQLGVLRFPGWAGIQVALDVILFIMAVMGGRVIPMFTNNGVPGAAATRKPLVEKAALGATLLLLAADVLQAGGWVLALVAIVAAAAHLVRWALWDPLKTLRTPIVWVLQVAYLWIPVHLGLRAAAALGWLAPSAATHALTVGAIGGLIIGMITRTARGHTGRPLQADRYETACYLMVLLAALVRVFVPLFAPALLLQAVVWSAVLWSAAFGLYFVRYWPVLTRPRLDGRPG
ncbi:NnrS family protein [Ramlibacter sp. RBP-2]|uniref:NnrS family protein n=2 Tax=Ramlibacter lithotrophicus TaxID=2606681 RepID=A0A7X6DC53_9BURK|nr:NnrS family protein [Ramlibacter lithotrophicus]NKE64459.1 NnrS family protein [Ramlibacter lithotrophicus]